MVGWGYVGGGWPGKMVRTCPVTKGFTCFNTPQDCHVVVRRSSRSVAKLFLDVRSHNFFLNCMRGAVL